MVLHHMCFHIQKSTDRGLFAAPRGLSQLVTSFFGSWCQGILLMLLFAWTPFDWYFWYISVLGSLSFQELLSTLKNSLFFRFVYLAIFTITCAAEIVFLPLILNFLERPIWFQILSSSLLTFSLTCLFLRVLINFFYTLFGFQWTFSKLNFSLSFQNT